MNNTNQKLNMISLGCAKALVDSEILLGGLKNENFDITAQIKWPNDVLIEGKKLCGILVETSIKQGLIYSAVVGIGLNVNQEFFKTENAVSVPKLSKFFASFMSIFL